MLTPHSNTGLSCTCPFHHDVRYDLSNYNVLLQTDGCFQISRYSIPNRFDVFFPNSFYLSVAINGVPLPHSVQKQVVMLGRMQTITLTHADITITGQVFLNENNQAVFQQFHFSSNAALDCSIEINFGFLLHTQSFWEFQTEHQLFNRTSQQPTQIIAVTGKENRLLRHQITPEWEFSLACSEPIHLREIEGDSLHYSLDFPLHAGKEHTSKIVYRMEDYEVPDPVPASQYLSNFDSSFQSALEYSQFLSDNAKGSTPLEKSLYSSCLNSALSNYTEMDDFKGFLSNAQYPPATKTFYRDSYFACLAALPYKPDWVKNQILMLALGVRQNGTCPDSVTGYRESHRPSQHDSGAFFITLLYEYICFTGNTALLNYVENGSTMLELAVQITQAMIDSADSNYLINRGKNDRKDWAGDIYREGYVTYIQALFYRSLYCTSKLLQLSGETQFQTYQDYAAKVRENINTLLWMPDQGHYYNYYSPQQKEPNLSLDTIFTVLYGVATPKQTRQLLANMQHRLETRYNAKQPFGNWGTMCVYPLYQHQAHLVEKSSHAFECHNGSDWPFLSCLYAFVKARFNMDYSYPLTCWYQHCLEHEWATPIGSYSPISGGHSFLHASSSIGAFVLDFAHSPSLPFDFFTNFEESLC